MFSVEMTSSKQVLELLAASGGCAEARKILFQRAVFGRTKILGENHPDALEVADLLATLPLAAEERVEERVEESPGTNSSRNTTRKRDRWKGLL